MTQRRQFLGVAEMRHGLVVEDLAASAQWLARVLTEAFPGIVAVAAETMQEARAAAQKTEPDIALVDLDLTDGSGVDLIREFTRTYPACRSIVATVYADDRHLFPALRAGAQGY
ncbi:response regulator transcription factor, partial [Escherichia coli]